MPSLNDVARIALSLPESTEVNRRGLRTWVVADKTFAWERPFTKADLKRFGDAIPPQGPIVAVRLGNLDEKDLLLMAPPKGFFTIPHFDGFPAVMIQLRAANNRDLGDALTAAWRLYAPTRVAPRRKPAP